MIVDTSAVLSLFFKEEDAPWVRDQFNRYQNNLKMSTVNLAEVLILIYDRVPEDANRLEKELLNGSIQFSPPNQQQALTAAKARLRFPLNLGDCFAYALAIETGLPLLTLDKDFLRSDIQVVHPVNT